MQPHDKFALNLIKFQKKTAKDCKKFAQNLIKYQEETLIGLLQRIT
jgi:hypothetical protein